MGVRRMIQARGRAGHSSQVVESAMSTRWPVAGGREPQPESGGLGLPGGWAVTGCMGACLFITRTGREEPGGNG